MDDKGTLCVVQARQQLQVSGDGGLNDNPIKVATTTVREVSTACGLGGTYTLLFVIVHNSDKYELILPSIIALLLQQDDTEVLDNETISSVKRHGAKGVKALKDDGVEGSFVSF